MIKTILKISSLIFSLTITTSNLYSQRLRDYGIVPGVFKTGKIGRAHV